MSENKNLPHQPAQLKSNDSGETEGGLSVAPPQFKFADADPEGDNGKGSNKPREQRWEAEMGLDSDVQSLQHHMECQGR